MSEDLLFDALREALWTATMISTPILAVALTVGLAVGLVQALTSVQEMTLTFVPKLLAMLAIFWASMGFMTTRLVDLYQTTVIPMIAGGF